VASPAEGLLSKPDAAERRKAIDPAHASTRFVAGDPMRFDSKVKTWPYWRADIADTTTFTDDPSPDAELLRGIVRDTTHIAVIDKDGNIFDSTPSGAWIPTAVVLGETGIPISVRGEAFRLDERRAQQYRPRSRPRYTLSPTIVLRGGEPFMALGSPGGDNQVQTILQAFLDVVEFKAEWYPNLHTAFEWPRLQTLHLFGSPYPYASGFNKLNLEAGIPETVVNELKARGHQASTIPAHSIASCATAVLIDEGTGSRIAAGDPRRDCYAIAY
jgi:gamma-glutamyltranspeptidase/glutathione hydrolase